MGFGAWPGVQGLDGFVQGLDGKDAVAVDVVEVAVDKQAHEAGQGGVVSACGEVKTVAGLNVHADVGLTGFRLHLWPMYNGRYTGARFFLRCVVLRFGRAVVWSKHEEGEPDQL